MKLDFEQTIRGEGIGKEMLRKYPDGKWVTMRGRHVYVRPNGRIAPETEVGREPWREVDPYNAYVEYVPVRLLKQFREYAWRRDTARRSPEEWDALKTAIAENGFTEALMFEFNPRNGLGILGEGNHRLAIADELGLEYVPVRGYRSAYMTKEDAPKAHRVDGWENVAVYTDFPQMFKPSDVLGALMEQYAPRLNDWDIRLHAVNLNVEFRAWAEANPELFAAAKAVRSDGVEKSFSSEIEAKYPGGQWVTMHGKHVYVVDGKPVPETAPQGGDGGGDDEPTLDTDDLGPFVKTKPDEEPTEDKSKLPFFGAKLKTPELMKTAKDNVITQRWRDWLEDLQGNIHAFNISAADPDRDDLDYEMGAVRGSLSNLNSLAGAFGLTPDTEELREAAYADVKELVAAIGSTMVKRAEEIQRKGYMRREVSKSMRRLGYSWGYAADSFNGGYEGKYDDFVLDMSDFEEYQTMRDRLDKADIDIESLDAQLSVAADAGALSPERLKEAQEAHRGYVESLKEMRAAFEKQANGGGMPEKRLRQCLANYSTEIDYLKPLDFTAERLEGHRHYASLVNGKFSSLARTYGWLTDCVKNTPKDVVEKFKKLLGPLMDAHDDLVAKYDAEQARIPEVRRQRQQAKLAENWERLSHASQLLRRCKDGLPSAYALEQLSITAVAKDAATVFDSGDLIESAGETKNRVVAAISGRLATDTEFIEGARHLAHVLALTDDLGQSRYQEFEDAYPDDEGMQVVAAMVGNWAVTSGDHNKLAIALQLAAQQEFGLDEGTLDTIDKTLRSSAESVLNARKPIGTAMRKFLRAQYEETQDFFRQRGITHVLGYRGMGFGMDNVPYTPKGEVTSLGAEELVARPMSSWSLHPATAWQFSGHGYSETERVSQRLVLTSVIPVEQILGTCQTGVGCKNEHEAVLLGGSSKAHATYINLDHDDRYFSSRKTYEDDDDEKRKKRRESTERLGWDWQDLRTDAGALDVEDPNYAAWQRSMVNSLGGE